MNRIQTLLFCLLCTTSTLFSQEEERNAQLVLAIRNEMEEVFQGNIRLIANHDTIPLIPSWNNVYRVDFIPGTYRIILQNKLFDDYQIGSLRIGAQETKELDICWEHRVIRLPEIRFPL
jgi:hypothetical protein